MASLTKKRIRGNTYYYVRECKRVDGRPKIVWQKYLGRLEDIVAAVTERREGTAVPQPEAEALLTDLGAVAALYDLSSRLGLMSLVDKHVPKRGSGPSVGTYLLISVINRCVAPCSKAKIGEWFAQTVLRRLVDIESRQLTSQRYWDNMERISPEAIAAIEAELTVRLVEEFEVDLSRLLFDATNFFTFIDTFNDRSSLAQRGKSKEGRAALRIVGLALLVSADFHIPLLHHTYPGNQHDAPTFRGLIDKLVARVQQLRDGIEHITFVFDKGNNSKDNLGAIAESPYHFVGSLVPTHHRDLLAVPKQEFHSLAEEGLAGVTAYRTTKKVFDHERTVLVAFNDNLFIAQCQTLLREIAKRHRKLRELVVRLERRRSGQVRRGRAPTVASTRKKVAGWLKARHMGDLFEVEVFEQEGLPGVRYEFNHEAWQELQRTLLGKTILFTDNDDWTDADIVRGYRAQHHVEAAFREMKDPHHIALRPQYCWTDQKIRVHVFSCVIGLMLVSLLRRELCKQGIDLSSRRLLELLDGIREIAMVFPPQGKQKEPAMRTSLSKMSPEQRQLFQTLDLRRYTSV